MIEGGKHFQMANHWLKRLIKNVTEIAWREKRSVRFSVLIVFERVFLHSQRDSDNDEDYHDIIFLN